MSDNVWVSQGNRKPIHSSKISYVKEKEMLKKLEK
jgi:hypothetical protein